jgi:hypothetical protein
MNIFKRQKRNPIMRTHVTYSITPKGLLRLQSESNPPLSIEAVKTLETLKHQDCNITTYGTDNPEPNSAIEELLHHKLIFKKREVKSFF